MTSALRPTAARRLEGKAAGASDCFLRRRRRIPMFFRLDGNVVSGSLDSESTFLPLGMITTLGFLVVNYRRLISMNWTLLHLLCFTLCCIRIVIFYLGFFSRFIREIHL